MRAAAGIQTQQTARDWMMGFCQGDRCWPIFSTLIWSTELLPTTLIPQTHTYTRTHLHTEIRFSQICMEIDTNRQTHLNTPFNLTIFFLLLTLTLTNPLQSEVWSLVMTVYNTTDILSETLTGLKDTLRRIHLKMLLTRKNDPSSVHTGCFSKSYSFILKVTNLNIG